MVSIEFAFCKKITRRKPHLTAGSEQNAVDLVKNFFLQGYKGIEFETKVGGSVYCLDWKIRARKC
jgi:hypothetical protein